MLKFLKRLLELTYGSKEAEVDKVLDSLETEDSLESIFERLKKDGLIGDYNEERLKVNFENRLKIATKAIQLGGDVEKICKKLDWKEFENFVFKILEVNAYNVRKHYRFEYRNKKYEFDILAYNDLFMLCIDCKHWKYGGQRSKLLEAARMQLDRVIAFSKLKKEMERIRKEKKLRIFPIVLTLMDVSFKELNGVPVVSILKFNDFLYRLSPTTDEFVRVTTEC
ncbi:MAG: hypothetical protein QW265_00835 [Candidatus Bathyarchaeia archaeon]